METELKLNTFERTIWDEISAPYPIEGWERDADDGTMLDNVQALQQNVVGHKIVKALQTIKEHPITNRAGEVIFVTKESVFELTLDNGKKVIMKDTDDCCAFTELKEFLVHPEAVDHMIMGVGTTDDYTIWHIFADFGDVMALRVDWSCGNPFYYGYGFSIKVEDAE